MAKSLQNINLHNFCLIESMATKFQSKTNFVNNTSNYVMTDSSKSTLGLYSIPYNFPGTSTYAGPILTVYRMQSPALFQNIFKFCTFLLKFFNIFPFFLAFFHPISENCTHAINFQNRPRYQRNFHINYESNPFRHKKWMGYSRKKKSGGIEVIIFLKTALEFLVFLLHLWKFETKQRFTPRNPTNNFITPQKLRLRPPGNSTLFLVNPWKFFILNPRVFF